ncbi:uracil-DNA glycosylase [Hyphomicrobium sp.]|uniref:uracil-DNA glycosylase n=1 Tax=Hyphomicrobium sp. TaxID=82 RepID=UPI002D778B9C|nr:uracil-DNA glycosylase family protein [Hyphomicrobium sp.]HET6389707.1 uracil-DNA glycosylase family protein [Hyphomicrobium sp.]
MLSLLNWLQAMGADAAVGDTAHDWLSRGNDAPGSAFAWPERGDPAPGLKPPSDAPRAEARPSARPPRAASAVEPGRPRAVTPLGASEAETNARRIARAANTLQELEAALQNFDGCGLKATATKLCFYRGAPASDLMIIGEAPGRDEDLAGKPFVGKAGQLLDKMLTAIGRTEADVHITNVVYWRPPGNRTPTPQETLACRPFLERQIELVSPKIVVAVGGSAAKEILGASEGIMRLRGKWRELTIGDRKIPALATLHPAYLLRTPAAKQLAWMDLLQIRTKL